MKLLFSTTIIYLSAFFSSYCNNNVFDNFDYYRVTADYNGSAYNGSSILVYGNAGIIVISDDGGNSWHQVSIEDSLNIMSILSLGKVYYGVVNKNYLIKSTDDGNTWQEKYLGNIYIYKILTYNNNLFCLTDNSILEYNQNIEKIKEYPITNDTTIFDFATSGDNLYYISGKGKINKIDLLNDNITTFKLKDLGFCNDCEVPSSLISADNILYFKLDDIIYSLTETTFVPVYNALQLNTIFASNSGELFELCNITYTSANLDSLYFNKIDTVSKTANRINIAENDRYITGLFFKNLFFLSKDTIIAVGKDKLIYMSYNRGHNWLLKSHFNTNDVYVRSRMSPNYAIAIGSNVKFVKTTDGGVTWLPQKNYMSYFANSRFADQFNGTAFYFCNELKGFMYYWARFQHDTNFAYTKDGGETVIMKNINELIGYSNLGPFHVYSGGDQILFTQSSIYQKEYFTVIYKLLNDLTYTGRSLIDSAHVYLFDKFDDKLMAFVKNYNHVNMNNPKVYDSVYLSLISSTDDGTSWKVEVDLRNFIFDSHNYLKIVTRVNENIYFSIWNNLDNTSYYYQLNTKTLQLNNILARKFFSENSNGFVGFDNKLFFSGSYYIQNESISDMFENDDIVAHPFDWESVIPNLRYSWFGIRFFNDTLILLSAYDSLTNSTVVWFAKPKVNSTIVDNMHIESDISIYLSSSMPSPGNEKIRVKIYWNQQLDINSADFKIYNSMGEVVIQNNKFNFDKLNDYSGYITWNCKDVNTGVYFLNVRLGSHTRSVPVVVVK